MEAGVEGSLSFQTISGQSGTVREIQNTGLRSYTDTNFIQFRRFLLTYCLFIPENREMVKVSLLRIL